MSVLGDSERDGTSISVRDLSGPARLPLTVFIRATGTADVRTFSFPTLAASWPNTGRRRR